MITLANLEHCHWGVIPLACVVSHTLVEINWALGLMARWVNL